MTDAHVAIQEIASQLRLLTEKLKQANDPDQRRALLKQFRALLGQADDVTKG